MREIKFRAWDVDNLEMWYSAGDNDDGEWGKAWVIDKDGIHFEEYKLWHSTQNGEDVEHEDWHTPKQVIMQFTGLKDKNGKEIFEGDIIRNKNNFSCITNDDKNPDRKIVIYNDEESKFCFEFIEDRLKKIGVSGYSFCKQNQNKFEVIGNIYENPKLL